MTAGQAALGVGASLRRKEDARFLHGLGRFVGDITRPGMLEVAFLRSPVAHARLLGVTKPVIIGHGISRGKSFLNMLKLAQKMIEADLLGKMKESFLS